MILTFADKQTAALFAGFRVRIFPLELHRAALRKLMVIDKSLTLNDLHSPPGNRLEKLAGDRNGQWSIRINDQWRICFRFENGDAFDVEITDYH
ncbi:MAG: plasmid maintenance system killer [Deltaproteobacteria bacterium RIFOXYD12_FULL_50_9]|nr:MAG: plasmid maintenance system killer [Deltaproteobacteria bacterium RIFOXYD12_FULL_50_9]